MFGGGTLRLQVFGDREEDRHHEEVSHSESGSRQRLADFYTPTEGRRGLLHPQQTRRPKVERLPNCCLLDRPKSLPPNVRPPWPIPERLVTRPQTPCECRISFARKQTRPIDLDDDLLEDHEEGEAGNRGHVPEVRSDPRPDSPTDRGSAGDVHVGSIDLFASVKFLEQSSRAFRMLLGEEGDSGGATFESLGVRCQKLAPDPDSNDVEPVVEVRGCNCDDFRGFLCLLNACTQVKSIPEHPRLPCRDIYSSLRYSVALQTDDLTALLLEEADEIASSSAPKAALLMVCFVEETCGAAVECLPFASFRWSADSLALMWEAVLAREASSLHPDPAQALQLCRLTRRTLYDCLCAVRVRGVQPRMSWTPPATAEARAALRAALARHVGDPCAAEDVAAGDMPVSDGQPGQGGGASSVRGLADGAGWHEAARPGGEMPLVMGAGRGDGEWVTVWAWSDRGERERGGSFRLWGWEVRAEQRVLVEGSAVFAAMLGGEWREARDRRVELEPGTTREAGEAFLMALNAERGRPSLPAAVVTAALPLCVLYQAEEAVGYLLREAERLATVGLSGRRLLHFMLAVEKAVDPWRATRGGRQVLRPWWGRRAMERLLACTCGVWKAPASAGQPASDRGHVVPTDVAWAVHCGGGGARERAEAWGGQQPEEKAGRRELEVLPELSRVTLVRLLAGLHVTGSDKYWRSSGGGGGGRSEDAPPMRIVRTRLLREAVLGALMEAARSASTSDECRCRHCTREADFNAELWAEAYDGDEESGAERRDHPPLCKFLYDVEGGGPQEPLQIDIRRAARSEEQLAAEVSRAWRGAVCEEEVEEVVDSLRREGLVSVAPSEAERQHYHSQSNWSADRAVYYPPGAALSASLLERPRYPPQPRPPQGIRTDYDPEFPGPSMRLVCLHDLRDDRRPFEPGGQIANRCGGWHTLLWDRGEEAVEEEDGKEVRVEELEERGVTWRVDDHDDGFDDM